MTITNTGSFSVQSGPASVAALFGDDTDSQPLWFKKEAFGDTTYDTEAYISDLRRFVPLETLRSELKSHLATLKNELVELINRDYADFVNLTTKLVDVDGAVLRMRLPLIELRGKLQHVHESTAGTLTSLQDSLRRRTEASNSRQTLELLLDTSHLLSKVEKLLIELQGMPAAEPLAAAPDSSRPGEATAAGAELEEARSRLLERISSEMNRLKFYVARGQDCLSPSLELSHALFCAMQELPFVQTMGKRIRGADERLAAQLRQCLVWGLDQRDTKVIYNCLRAYAALDGTVAAEATFREVVVSPMVARVLGAAGRGAAGKGGDQLAEVYETLSLHIQADCRFLLDLIAAPNSGLHAFEFLSNSILRQVHAALSHARPGAFSPGRPQQFLANYKASLAFLSSLEGYCRTHAALLAFRSHAAYQDFIKQWNLGAYFNLRFGEIAEALDTVLQGKELSLVNPTKGGEPGGKAEGTGPDTELGLLLAPSTALWEALVTCWRPDVHVASLSDKFLRLSLQLLSRYTAWVSAGLAARKAGGTAAAAAGQSSSFGEWGLSDAPEDFILVRYDVELLAEAVASKLSPHVGAHLGPAVPPPVRSAAESALRASAQAVLSLTPAIFDVLIEAITDKCVEVLRQLKGITTTYRMTNKPLPTRHSLYVANVLQPLKGFVEGSRASYFSASSKEELIVAVVTRVTVKYDDMARELVTTVRKTETSLRMMKARATRKGVSSEASGSNISDSEKITAQLFFDVQEYGRQVLRFGLKLSDINAYSSLWECVASPDRPTVDL
eukprot:jgi/Mesen1/6169/ME000317S05297